MFSKVVSKSTTALRENEIGSLGNGTQLVTPCSKDLMVHYSFDYAQQTHYPYS